MALIVEDGSLVDGANSFVSLDFARDFAADRGVLLPTDDAALSAMLIESADYIDALECGMQGSRVESGQPLSWPRAGVFVGEEELPSIDIPARVKAAQVRLAMAINDGIQLQGNTTAQSYVKREKVGPLETEYADPLSVGMSPSFPAVDALLSVFTLKGCNGGMSITTRRV